MILWRLKMNQKREELQLGKTKIWTNSRSTYKMQVYRDSENSRRKNRRRRLKEVSMHLDSRISTTKWSEKQISLTGRKHLRRLKQIKMKRNWTQSHNCSSLIPTYSRPILIPFWSLVNCIFRNWWMQTMDTSILQLSVRSIFILAPICLWPLD